MKFKRSSKGRGVLVELSPQEVQLPGDGEAGKPIAAFTIKKILVPVDFSECSNKALQYAIPIAKQFGAKITLMHALLYPFESAEMAMAEAAGIQAAREELNRLSQKIGDGITTRAILRVGKAPGEIVEAAKETGADLIVISTHGRSGLAHVLLGSTAERVVRHAPCPVLVVREKEHEFVTGDPDYFTPVI
jgi:nucleotide-binding universal stress UspA family protein